MKHFVTSTMNQNKREQTAESVQYGLEILTLHEFHGRKNNLVIEPGTLVLSFLLYNSGTESKPL